jgi:hypothetical protein
VTPSGDLVVGRVALETAVEDADESVAEGPEGGVVGVTGRSSGVVEGPGAGRGREGGESPEVDRIG